MRFTGAGCASLHCQKQKDPYSSPIRTSNVLIHPMNDPHPSVETTVTVQRRSEWIEPAEIPAGFLFNSDGVF